jgi:hypothetical protein
VSAVVLVSLVDRLGEVMMKERERERERERESRRRRRREKMGQQVKRCVVKVFQGRQLLNSYE